MTPFEPQAACPLDDVRVLDLSRLVAGNILTHILGDFGAEVIKVEPPGGDPLRAWRVKGVATHWKTYARNKRSVGLNLRTAPGRALVLRLVPKAQVLVENFRPGTLEEMGLAPQILFEHNPRLVVVRISGWGQTGPYRKKPGFGTLVEGFSGLAAMTGFPDREPVLPPFHLADSVAGIYGAAATLIALREVEVNGGAGQVIDLSLLEPLLAILGPQAANFALTGRTKQRTGSRSTTAAPRNVYRTRDGEWLCLSASIQAMAERVFRAIGRADLAADPRYATNAARVEHGAELDAIIGAFIGERTLAENLALFERAEVTLGPIYDISGILRDPHVRERGVIVELPDDEMTRLPVHAVVPRLSKTPGAIRGTAPRIGEHNWPVLSELGLDAAEFRRLVEAGVVHEGKAPLGAAEGS